MKRRKLVWNVFPYYLAIIILALVLAALYASSEIRRLYFDEITDALEIRARLILRRVADPLAAGDGATIDSLCKELGQLSQTRITVVDREGRILGDSDQDPAVMENHAQRPEIMQALAGTVGTEIRFSNTLQTTMIYVAVPADTDGAIIGAVRTANPFTAAESALAALYRKLLLNGLIITVVATLLSLFLFRRITRPLAQLQQGATAFADGRLASRLAVTNIEEIAVLAESLNLMAGNLASRIHLIEQQRNELEAILASMSEGVIALDANENVVTLNQTAATLLEIDPTGAQGHPIHEVARFATLHDFIGRALAGDRPVEQEIVLTGEPNRYLHAHGSGLLDAEGRRVGVVVVINDITRLKRLENVRRDFVANVSHELKTPITAIAGAAETLLDGGGEKPDDNRKFLEMIIRHTARLNSLVEDLMSLARLENETEGGKTRLSSGDVAAVVESSVLTCRQIAQTREVIIEVAADKNLMAQINPVQLEHALINLIDNATKYSAPGSTIYMAATASDNEIIVSVQDHGCGIKSVHLPRLFERFYRVDAARSRHQGGTGLGLAIVKHVVQAHNGRVEVKSTLGSGSTFSIYLPRLV
jgi:two-component system phosphate regulon sensor histidine kinase PhoR